MIHEDLRDSTGNSPPISVPGDEPAFRISTERHVRLPSGARTSDSAVYLAHRVARFPSDLLAHVQRIQLHLDLDDRDGANAALVDLFIALGESGKGLRERLLGQAAPRLSAEARRFLEKALEEPLEPRSAVSPSAGSVLSRGLVGDWRLVERVDGEAQTNGDVLEEADSLLYDGDLGGATELLEAALLAEPERADIGALLIEVYRHSRDVQRFEKTCERMHGSGQALPLEWLKLARELKDEQS